MSRNVRIVLIAIIIVFLLAGFVAGVHPFMSITNRVQADLLLVEGWLSSEELCRAVEESHSGNYQLVVTTGGPLQVGDRNDWSSYAERARATLVGCGIDPARVAAVIAPAANRDQSTRNALAFRSWLRSSEASYTGVNVLTSGIHGRRSRALYRRLLASESPVGVISIGETRYRTSLWFLSPMAIRKVVRNTGGYFYYRFLLRVPS
jgi:hypothetical protein